MEQNRVWDIHSPDDIRNLDLKETEELCRDIRSFLIENVARTGGHLSSNLGVVELTTALCQSFDLSKDKVVWDVGHQAYVYKILTGRSEGFSSLRQYGGMSGFPKQAESTYDIYDAGHASTSISVAYGLAKARDLKNEDHHVVCVIGDGSLTGGMAYEAMNNAGHDKSGLIVILNDNKMSINKSVGSLANHLGRLRTRSAYLRGKKQVKKTLNQHPGLSGVYKASHYLKDRIKYMVTDGILFEELGFTYLGPVDGHDVQHLKEVMEQAKILKEPVLIHVITQKGKGYEPAEKDPERFHGTGPFDPVTGLSLGGTAPETYAEVFGKTVGELGKEDSSVALVTAAMTDGTGLSESEKYMANRVFDVGIAEEHAVTFAGGLAKGGMRPFVAIYSTFLQRSYDQILEDICLQDVPVVLALDHAGIVGEDGETHQGVFDLSYLSHMPNMSIMAPSSKEELVQMIRFAKEYDHPIAIRYPKGAAEERGEAAPLILGKGVVLKEWDDGKNDMPKVTILSVGCMCKEALAAAKAERNANVKVVNVRFVKPLDHELIHQCFEESDLVITMEDGVMIGGFGMMVQNLAAQEQWKTPCRVLALPDTFLSQDKRDHALSVYGLDERNVHRVIESYIDR